MTDDELLLLRLRNERLRMDRESQERAFVKHRQSLEVINRLRSIGLWPKHMNTPEYLEIVIKAAWKIEVMPEDLPKLRTVFETVKDTGNYEVKSADEGTVAVTLDLGFPAAGIYVQYIKPLPPDSRCRIVSQNYVSHELVCGV